MIGEKLILNSAFTMHGDNELMSRIVQKENLLLIDV